MYSQVSLKTTYAKSVIYYYFIVGVNNTVTQKKKCQIPKMLYMILIVIFPPDHESAVRIGPSSAFPIFHNTSKNM